MVSCWQERPEARPAFQTIGDYFEWILKESEKTADISRSETENGGETTDEGPYAVIPEGSSEDRKGPGGGNNNGNGFNGMRLVNGKTKSISRPMSAPGLTKAIIASTTTVLTSCESDTESNNNTNSSSTLDARRDIIINPDRTERRRSFLEQLKKVVWTGSSASNNENNNNKLIEDEAVQEQIRRRRGQLQQQEGIEMSDEAIPIYNNVN
uniref:Pkinase_Tyr domain-containing protein n=1 Tax=Meloidogyne hapla TaxID=6305 RepID=A0A1I8AYN2_MELHA